MAITDGFPNGWRRVNGYWISDEVLASNHTWVNQMLLVHQNVVYPGTPELKVDLLPICSECHQIEVVPGEDACRVCLGSPEPPWEYEYYTPPLTQVQLRKAITRLHSGNT